MGNVLTKETRLDGKIAVTKDAIYDLIAFCEENGYEFDLSACLSKYSKRLKIEVSERIINIDENLREKEVSDDTV